MRPWLALGNARLICLLEMSSFDSTNDVSLRAGLSVWLTDIRYLTESRLFNRITHWLWKHHTFNELKNKYLSNIGVPWTLKNKIKKEQFLKETDLIYFLNICGIFWAWHISVFLKDKMFSEFSFTIQSNPNDYEDHYWH